MNLVCLIKSTLKAIDIISLIIDNSPQDAKQKKGLYTGHIAYVSDSTLLKDPKDPSSISYIQYLERNQQNKKENFKDSQHLFIIPKELYLEEKQVYLNINNEALQRSSRDWPVLDYKISTNKETFAHSPRYQKKKQSGFVNWITNSILPTLRLSHTIDFEYCTRGFAVGSYVFCYGMKRKTLTHDKFKEILDVEYFSTSIHLMKNFLKEKFGENILISTLSLLFIGIGGYLVWNSFKSKLIQVLKGKNVTQSSQVYGSKSRHYPIYRNLNKELILKCECQNYCRNIINFPCCHLDKCFSCFQTRQKRICGICNEFVYDFFITKLTQLTY